MREVWVTGRHECEPENFPENFRTAHIGDIRGDTVAATMTILVAIEGNIGCGKSTLLKNLANFGVRVVPEPVSLWEEHLKNVYAVGEGADAWKLPMQALCTCTRHEELAKRLREASAVTDAVVVTERGRRGSGIFSALTLTPGEQDAMNLLEQRYGCALGGRVRHDATVYLRASPKTCAGRASRRSRSGEEGLDLAFLEALHEAHEAEFSEGADLVVDAEQDARAVWARVSLFIDSLKHSAPSASL